MLQKPWFKLIIWFLATFFFFLASGVIISLLKPGPSENEVMQYMSGMMGAMENSFMGVMMSVESSSSVMKIFYLTIKYFPLMIIISVIIGFVLRIRNKQ